MRRASVRVMRNGVVAFGLLLATVAAWAGGPRFISGTSGYTQAGIPMAWYTNQPAYFTDPGNLGSAVTHAQADAMVAAAAAIWNMPTTSLTLTQGGELAEHVSGANSYFNGTSVVFPADVLATNYQAIQIAIVYDSDGSITNLLLGSGASDPSGCLQNGVIESVDSFGTNATIQHAVIVLNGLCVGSSSQQMLQMQYQLTRVFGRVLGLAWSQLEDNVFTGVSQVTAAQMAVWPLMHPVDIICGPYTYLCMQNPFTLRFDDIAALTGLYPVTTTAGGKTLSSVNTAAVSGTIAFPSHQGMELVSIEVTRETNGVWAQIPTASAITGATFQQDGGNPVSGVETAAQNAGINQANEEGAWSIPNLPIGAGPNGIWATVNPINPLYYGDAAVGAYRRAVVTMSGSYQFWSQNISAGMNPSMTIQLSYATTNWCQYPDGTEASPRALAAIALNGMWIQSLCSPGYVGWRQASANANTSWTIEVAAVNESGVATAQKMQPVIGVWNSSDPTGTTPTVASQKAAGNSMVIGMTQLRMPATASASSFRIAIAEQYGSGRPDFVYVARILYAASVVPATLSSGGGQIVITGTGFVLGNQVLVNGVAATVTALTCPAPMPLSQNGYVGTVCTIVATAPTMGIAGATGGTAVDVVVKDATTGGSTDMKGALKYVVANVDQVSLVSAPAVLETGFTATTPFAVRVFKSDGVTPLSSATVTFVVMGSGGGAAVFTGCLAGQTGCVVKTDATGLASTPVLGISAGGVTLRGTELSGGNSAQAVIADADPVRAVVINAGSQYLAAGASGSWSLGLTATQDGAAAVGVGVAWASTGVGFTLTPPGELTGANGSAAVVAQVNAISGGTGEFANVVTGCAWSTVCASWTVYGVATSQWTIAVSSGAGQSVTLAGAALAPVVLLVTDGAGHALPGASVNVYQTDYAWEGACSSTGACASAPVLKMVRSSAVSDANGLVTVMPLRVAGVAQVVKIAVATGTKGFATASLNVTP